MGELKKISGPVVAAKDMQGTQINEVVNVGNSGLMGEVIALKYDVASIQVYEDTSGLKPQEKVTGTGLSLAVELGPGLLSSTFDGIQRPLDTLSKGGSPYIARGVRANSLDRNKKWDFKPSVKKGDEVAGGQIIGSVKEFDFDHKIMLPPSVSGEIISIEKGNHTIEEIVAVVKTKDGKKVEVTMMQKWPVRVPRPMQEKLRIEPPLLTGMRIFDTFYPMAKGGAGAIPGPFGSGKCISAQTPVLLANGELKTIKQLYDQLSASGTLVEKNEHEEYYEVKEPIQVFSLNGNQIMKATPSRVYKGKTSRMIKITTRSGNKIEVTPIHKLFALEDYNIVETEAQKLEPGQLLTTPRQMQIEQEDAIINYFEIFKDTKNVKIENGKLLTAKGKTIKLPETMSPDFGKFLGYVIADGNLNKYGYRVRFYNSSQELLDDYAKTLFDLFGLTPNIYPHPKSPNSFICEIASKGLFNILVAIGIPYVKKAHNASIPTLLLKSSNKTLAAFIGAYIACDGSIYKKGGRVEIASSERKVLEQFKFALLRFGIVSSIEKTRKDGTHRLLISSLYNLSKLSASCQIPGKKGRLLVEVMPANGWSAKDAVPVPSLIKEYLLSEGMINKLNDKGVYTCVYAQGKEKIGLPMLEKALCVASQIKEVPIHAQEFLQLYQNVYFDEILDIQIIDEDTEVYDLEIPFYHNFVGGFGPVVLHNTVTQTSLAKYSDADVIVYCGCGERGNEMTEVLVEFPKLIDPNTKKPLMNRTVLIANTSNMPVAAREASIYTSITIAEYYRDMGYDVALMADSTSRWAEAMREISGRMEEMPGEEGYPAYLGKKLAEFYERAGRVKTLNGAQGSITVVGAVSPAGGDISEPVSQSTLRVTKVFWALDSSLSRKRHFPAINWLKSYTLYLDDLTAWYSSNVSLEFMENRNTAMNLLQKEAELQNIVQLIGPDALPDKERLVLEATKMIREDFLQQNAYDEVDAYSSLKKQFWMLKTILHFYNKANAALAADVPFEKIVKAPEKISISRLKIVADKDLEKECQDITKSIDAYFKV